MAGRCIYPSSIEYDADKTKFKDRNWHPTQELALLIFWADKIIEKPEVACDFSKPLPRRDFKKTAAKMMKHLPDHLRKNESQCRSKYSTYKRAVMRESKRDGSCLTFVDFIILKLIKLAPECQEVKNRVESLKKLQETESPFMQLTKKLLRYELNIESDVNDIRRYMKREGIFRADTSDQ